MDWSSLLHISTLKNSPFGEFFVDKKKKVLYNTEVLTSRLAERSVKTVETVGISTIGPALLGTLVSEATSLLARKQAFSLTDFANAFQTHNPTEAIPLLVGGITAVLAAYFGITLFSEMNLGRLTRKFNTRRHFQR